MGSEFFWFLDILAAAIIIVYIFRGAHRGAVSVIISAAAAIVACVAAFSLCGPISEKIYDSFIRENVTSYVSDKLGGVFGREPIAGMSQIDMSKAKINGIYLSETVPEYDETNTAIVDLSLVDLTETGVQNADLSSFGVGRDIDYSAVKVGKITVTKAENEKYGMGNIVLAHIIASNLTSDRVYSVFADIGAKISKTFVLDLKGIGTGLENGSTDAVYSIVVSVISGAQADYGEKLIGDIVTPLVLTPLRIIVFFIIFVLVELILNVIAQATKLINRIPVISSVNGFFGAVLGALQGVIMMMLICLAVRFIITLCGDSLVFINQTTIDKTFIFRFFYSFGPLKIIGIS